MSRGLLRIVITDPLDLEGTPALGEIYIDAVTGTLMWATVDSNGYVSDTPVPFIASPTRGGGFYQPPSQLETGAANPSGTTPSLEVADKNHTHFVTAEPAFPDKGGSAGLFVVVNPTADGVAYKAGMEVPTGTGFVHITAGVEDGAAQMPSYTDVGAAAASHTHDEADITNLTTDLGLKADVSDLAAKAPACKEYSFPGTLSVHTGKLRWYPQVNIHVKTIRAYVDTPSTGADINLDINKNGSTLLTGALSIAASANAGSRNENVAVTTTDYIQIDIDQVGSTEPGRDLVICIDYTVD